MIMHQKPLVYQYDHEGTTIDVPFYLDDDIFVNVTEISKYFKNKRPAKFLELASTKEYMEGLVAVRKSDSVENLTVTVVGGFGGGGYTLYHRNLAMRYIQWCSVPFAIWCDDIILRILKLISEYETTASFIDLYEHVRFQTQRDSSKAIGKKVNGIFKESNLIPIYFRRIMKEYYGKYPNQIITKAKEYGLPSKVTTSSREVLRYFKPEVTAAISFIENTIASNPNKTIDDIDELIPFGKRLEPIFKDLIALEGYCDPEDIEKIAYGKNYRKMKLQEKNEKKED